MTEDELLFTISKLIAESDSISEQYHYCPRYTIEHFTHQKAARSGTPLNEDYSNMNYVDLAGVIIKVVQSCSA